MRTQKYFRISPVMLLLFIIFVSVLVSSCSLTPPSFKRGIRITSEENVDTIGGQYVTLPYAPCVGNYSSAIGPPGPTSGNSRRFNDYTDGFGIYDEEEAVTNANWLISVGPTFSPRCPPAAGIVIVPIEGETVKYRCHPVFVF